MKIKLLLLIFLLCSQVDFIYCRESNTAQASSHSEELQGVIAKSTPVPLNELKGFTGLTFWSLPSSGGEPKKTEEFVQKLTKLLETNGRVSQIKEENGIDFEGFKTGAIVYLDNSNILVQDPKTHKEAFAKSIECVSLMLMTPIVIKKNGKEDQASIYSKTLYVDDSSGFDSVEGAALTLTEKLLQELFLANPDIKGKAQFFIYN